MKRSSLIRGLFLIAIAIFFGYRYMTLEITIHIVGLAIFFGTGSLTLLNKLSARWQNTALNVGITWLFLDLVFATIDLTEVAEALAQANYWMLIPAGLLVFIHLIFRAIRWQWLLKPIDEVAFWPAFRAMSIGLAGNILLPARAGEFIRAYVLGHSADLSKSSVFATLVIERILDGLTVVTFLVVAIVFGVNNDLMQQVGMAGAAIYLVLLAGLIVFMVKRHWADMILSKILPANLAERAFYLLNHFSTGLNVLRNPYQLTVVAILSVITWSFIPFSFWAALLAFDFQVTIPWQTPAMMFPVVALGLTLPGTPGGLGWFQFAVKITLDTTLNQAQVGPHYDEIAGAASIVVHIAQLIPQLIAGFICFWFEGLSTSELKQQVDKKPQAAA